MVCQQEQRHSGTERQSHLTILEVPKQKSKSRRNYSAAKLRRRLEVLMLVTAIVGICWLAGLSTAQYIRAAFATPAHVLTATITIAPGDSIWSISKAIARPGELQPDVVAEIRQLNPSLQSKSILRTGETIKVPRV